MCRAYYNFFNQTKKGMLSLPIFQRVSRVGARNIICFTHYILLPDFAIPSPEESAAAVETEIIDFSSGRLIMQVLSIMQ